MAKLTDVVEAMKQTLREASPAHRFDKVLSLAMDFLVEALTGDPSKGQAAVLMVLPEDQQLAFTYPTHLAGGNMIPIDRDSFAGRAVLEKTVLIENNAAKEEHRDVFERIPGPDGQARTIQKMLAAPFFDQQGNVLGIIEISRTGNTPADAGPDFSPKDGENLTKSCRIFAPFIAHTWAQRDP